MRWLMLGCLALITFAPPALADKFEQWAVNGPSEDPPVPTDRSVILGTVGKTVKTLGIISRPLFLQFVSKDSGSDQTNPRGGPKSFYFDHDGYELASAPAGEYALKSVHWSSEMVTWELGGWSSASPAGTFKLAPGEVIYVGHLVIEPGNSIYGPSEDNKLLVMRVEDRFEEYRKELPPHLRDVVQKRLITLPAQIEFPHAERKVMSR